MLNNLDDGMVTDATDSENTDNDEQAHSRQYYRDLLKDNFTASVSVALAPGGNRNHDPRAVVKLSARACL